MKVTGLTTLIGLIRRRNCIQFTMLSKLLLYGLHVEQEKVNGNFFFVYTFRHIESHTTTSWMSLVFLFCAVGPDGHWKELRSSGRGFVQKIPAARPSPPVIFTWADNIPRQIMDFIHYWYPDMYLALDNCQKNGLQTRWLDGTFAGKQEIWIARDC